MTKFRPLSRFTDSSETDRQAALPISVIVHNDPTSEYKYLLKSVNDPPQIRVVVPGAFNCFLSLSANITCVLLHQARSGASVNEIRMSHII